MKDADSVMEKIIKLSLQHIVIVSIGRYKHYIQKYSFLWDVCSIISKF